MLVLVVLANLAETLIFSAMAKPDRKPDPDYDEGSQDSFSDGAQAEYSDDVRDPDADDGGSQEWRLRPQR